MMQKDKESLLAMNNPHRVPKMEQDLDSRRAFAQAPRTPGPNHLRSKKSSLPLNRSRGGPSGASASYGDGYAHRSRLSSGQTGRRAGLLAVSSAARCTTADPDASRLQEATAPAAAAAAASILRRGRKAAPHAVVRSAREPASGAMFLAAVPAAALCPLATAARSAGTRRAGHSRGHCANCVARRRICRCG